MINKHINKGVAAKPYKGVMLDANIEVSPFGENRATEIAYKKAEGLATATYLVTNLIPTRETIRENLREYSQGLLPIVMDMRDGIRFSSTRKAVAHTRQILSLLDIAHASGNISNMNLEVLKHAYGDFVRFLNSSTNKDSAQNGDLGEDYFTNISKGQKLAIKDTVKDINVKDTKSEIDERPKSVKFKRQVANRRVAILDVITKRGSAHIKDISSEISDYGVKTIQRELSSLINDGIIKKEGSKRWTTYSIVI